MISVPALFIDPTSEMNPQVAPEGGLHLHSLSKGMDSIVPFKWLMIHQVSTWLMKEVRRR